MPEGHSGAVKNPGAREVVGPPAPPDGRHCRQLQEAGQVLSPLAQLASAPTSGLCS